MARRRRLAAVLVTALAMVLGVGLLSAGATVASGEVDTVDGPSVPRAAPALAGAAPVATVVRTVVSAAPVAGPSLVEDQLHAQRSAQLQTMLQTMLTSQPSTPVSEAVDPRVDQASCALLGRTWSVAGCSRESCVTGHEYAKTGANAETCRIGGRRGASYGVEVDFRRCEALHRAWISVLNYCASDPHRTESVISDAAQCRAPFTSYVLMSETEGSYDECLRPSRVEELRAVATSTGQPLAVVAAQRSRTQCGWAAQHVWSGGVCVAGQPTTPVLADNVVVIGDSITWRGTNELATLEPDWVIDGSSGRQVDALDERLAAYRAAHGEPGGVVFALGTNGRSGFTEAEFRASIAQLPPSVPVLFVTPYRQPGTTGRPELVDTYDAWMHVLAKQRARTCIADWREAVTTDPTLLVDGVHPTSVGEVFWAELVDRSWNTCLERNDLTSS